MIRVLIIQDFCLYAQKLYHIITKVCRKNILNSMYKYGIINTVKERKEVIEYERYL